MLSPSLYRNVSAQENANNFKIIGHRGAAGLAPENSKTAIELAMKLNVARIEIDVHLTKDNVPVVIHDYTIDRTSNGKGAIKELTFEEIKNFRLKNLDGSVSKDLLILSLEEVMQIIDGKNVLLIEIKKKKGQYKGIEDSVVNTIKRHNAYSWCIVQSFSDNVLKNVHKADSKIELHKLLVAWLPIFNIIFDGKFNKHGLEDYTYITEFGLASKFATKKVINKIHKLNKKINVWTVDDEKKMKRLINLGVDGIITNFPDKLLNIKNK